jgi:Tfp pilus assembly protein PilF
LRQATGALRIRAQLALGRACLAIPGWLRRAESHFQEVLHEDPMQLDAHLLLGDLYRTSELPARATAMYRKSLELQPNNRHALRELARLESAVSPPAESASLLGFLKKR